MIAEWVSLTRECPRRSGCERSEQRGGVLGWGGSGKLLAVTAEREPGEGYCLGVCPGVLRAPLLPNPPLSPTRVTEPWIAFCPPLQPAHGRGRLGPSLCRAGSCPFSPGLCRLLPASPPRGSPLTGLSAGPRTRPHLPSPAGRCTSLQGPFPPPAAALSAWPSSPLPAPWGLGSLKPAEHCPGTSLLSPGHPHGRLVFVF